MDCQSLQQTKLDVINCILVKQIFHNSNNCYLGNEGAKHLTKGNWSKLQVLEIHLNKIGIEGFTSLNPNSWKQLSKLWAEGVSLISILQAVSMIWKSKLKYTYETQNRKIKKGIKAIMKNKFI